MRTIKLKILGVLATMLFGATVSYGQSVYYDVNEGGVVIDCTMMPAGTVLTESQESDDDHQLPSTEKDDENSEANKVYPKLVVAMSDLPSGEMKWDDAVAAAKAKDEGTGLDDWRLPNQRELMLIYVLRNKIEDACSAASFTSFQSGYYWSSTVFSNYSSYRWYVYFGNGFTDSYNNAIIDRYARAVREIKLP